MLGRKTTFKKLIDKLANATLLAFPDPSVQFIVQTDAFDSVIGALLQQRQSRGWRSLSFFSSRFTPEQCNYNAYDRELLTIYAAIQYFRFMLEGRRFLVMTDHEPLTFSQKLDRASPRQCCQLTFILKFNRH